LSDEKRMPELRVMPSAEAVADAAAIEIARGLAAAIAARGVAHVATTGGSSAPGVYRRLGRSPLRETVDWSRVHVWWGDDRFVPSDHPLSNVLPFAQILLASGGDEEGGSPEGADVGGSGAGVHIPAEHIHTIPVAGAIAHSGGPAWAAAAYAESLRAAGLPVTADGDPVLDVIVLGVGPDGHVLSVFRGSPAWDATETVVGVPAPTHIEPHVARVTIHPRLVALAEGVVLLTTGASKADVIARAWAGADVRELAVAAARVPNAVWILDEAAAAGLPKS
jgi:6-phosphogluconolactonase